MPSFKGQNQNSPTDSGEEASFKLWLPIIEPGRFAADRPILPSDWEREASADIVQRKVHAQLPVHQVVSRVIAGYGSRGGLLASLLSKAG